MGGGDSAAMLKHTRLASAAVAVLTLTGISAASWAQETEAPEWSYEGATGPANWAGLSPQFATCGSGSEQSPIDLRATRERRVAPIRVDYRPSRVVEENNGETIVSEVAPGNRLRVGRRSYELVQFHLHIPSEHTVRSRRFPMELHFVHRDENGALAVLGVLLTRGERNAVYERIAAAQPRERGQRRRPAGRIDLDRLLPRSFRAYRYDGSLTTPPCSEGVRWMVLRQPVELSRSQIASYARLFERTSRPVQPRGGRAVDLG
jgi:carbonic anhydrase